MNTHRELKPAALGSMVLQFSGSLGGAHSNNQRASAGDKFTQPWDAGKPK